MSIMAENTMNHLFDIIWSSLKALTIGNIALLRFYLSHLITPYFHLPKELYNESHLSKRVAKGEDFDLIVDKKFVDGYNQSINNLKEHVKALWGANPHVDFRTKQTLFWIVRLVTIAAAFSTARDQSLQYQVLLVSLLQFIVLPYSLAVALGYGLETVLVLYPGHIFVAPILTALSNAFIAEKYNLTITISPNFLLAFIIIDQVLCAVTLFVTPSGQKVERVPAKRVWYSIWYGFLNCKTYYLILLPLAYGQKIAVVPWLVDSYFGLSSKITKRTMAYWPALFYHTHRIGHIPIVYADVHRFHHHLHDATSFDAHIFGSGAPEEWLILLTDVLMARLLNIPPASLGPSVLAVSWYNKWGFHSRKANPVDDGDNFHVNHHALHVKNVAITYPYDILMGTAMKDEVQWQGYETSRVEAKDGRTFNLHFVLKKKIVETGVGA